MIQYPNESENDTFSLHLYKNITLEIFADLLSEP